MALPRKSLRGLQGLFPLHLPGNRPPAGAFIELELLND
jgi:hypothetical protein